MTLSASPLQVVTSYFQALAEGRVTEALAMLDKNVEWHQPGKNRFSGVHRGPEAVGNLIGDMMAVSAGTFSLAVAGAMMVNGDLVAVPVHFSGQRQGAGLNQDGIDLITVREGKIVTVQLFSSDGPAEDAFWGKTEGKN
ncbi:nuclear transport factor 2 family protein [Rothia nasimurium]|uniref:nuclear transport factor 2 family protein n=1 Tax=Rothia nasimurium TaxID=85336 RepID=UPI003621B0B5